MSIEILKTAVASYTKDIENRITDLLKDVPENVVMSALGNLLIRKCQKHSVKKQVFLKKMGDGWDYHHETDSK